MDKGFAMRWWQGAGWVAVAMALMVPSPYQQPYSPMPQLERATQQVPGGFSVMTYNVKGLPWPIALGRGLALAEIGTRLADMRVEGLQPTVVMLQEAFVDDAKAIGARAGYRYAEHGPKAAPEIALAPLGEDFAEAARADRGETLSPVLDSGLMIFSDYPIVRTERVAFPRGACAGFDCLASKGVVIAWIALPGFDRPVAFVNTHLNSRKATHVELARADAAYAWQVKYLAQIVDALIDDDTPVIFGGDFNVGEIGARQSAFASFAPLGERQSDALASAMVSGTTASDMDSEVQAIRSYNKDMLLTRNGSGEGGLIAAEQALVPFPKFTVAAPLSDHAGLMIRFRKKCDLQL